MNGKKEIKDVLKNVKEVSSLMKESGGSFISNLSNKDFNLWLVNKLVEQDGRITKIETRQNMMYWFLGIFIALVVFTLKVIVS